MPAASRKFTIPVACIADGSGTAYSPYFSGFIDSIQYTNTDFAAGVDFTLTVDETGDAILTLTDQNANARFYPRAATCSTAGVESRFVAADALSPVRDKIALGRDRVKFVVAQGGATKGGTFVIVASDRKSL